MQLVCAHRIVCNKNKDNMYSMVFLFSLFFILTGMILLIIVILVSRMDDTGTQTEETIKIITLSLAFVALFVIFAISIFT